MDLPCAVLDYKGLVMNCELIQDNEKNINVLASIHESPNRLILTSMHDFHMIDNIPLPFKSRFVNIHPNE